ncbi:MAG: hypothetical protein H6712_17750 [Myxococcales bacterium]|nr:hypothetical protein [Myxococcales bacterium]MCB9715719.1 hypothetical protein [Myxococcales bacterium]
MRRAVVIGQALALVVGIAAGSCGDPAFVCEDDSGCAGLADAVCEANGYCSVPDLECNSGRRYAPHSGELSDRCVPHDDGSDGSTGEPVTDATSLPPLDGTTAIDGDETTSTGDEPRPIECAGERWLLEPFDDDPPDPDLWYVYEDDYSALSTASGSMRITVDDPAMDQGAYAGMDSLVGLPMAGEAGAQLLSIPDADLPAEAFFVLEGPKVTAGFDIYGGEIGSFFHNGEYLERVVVPFDPEAHRWIRIVFDELAMTVRWETSPDGLEWSTFDVEAEPPADWLPSLTNLDIGAGVWSSPAFADPLLEIDDVFVCARL